MLDEVRNIRERYQRRDQNCDQNDKYNIFNPEVYLRLQERERKLINLIKRNIGGNIHDKSLLEIGCGHGGNLLQFIKLGFLPQKLVGNDLLEDRIDKARECLPSTLQLVPGDARVLKIPENSFDIVYQSVVFSSILDDNFQHELANKMWSMVKNGGGILWYDFIYDNPWNPDVRGVSVKRVRELFPEGNIKCNRLTLAPPLGRIIAPISPKLYSLFNGLFFLNTHILCWIEKKN